MCQDGCNFPRHYVRVNLLLVYCKSTRTSTDLVLGHKRNYRIGMSGSSVRFLGNHGRNKTNAISQEAFLNAVNIAFAAFISQQVVHAYLFSFPPFSKSVYLLKFLPSFCVNSQSSPCVQHFLPALLNFNKSNPRAFIE